MLPLQLQNRKCEVLKIDLDAHHRQAASLMGELRLSCGLRNHEDPVHKTPFLAPCLNPSLFPQLLISQDKYEKSKKNDKEDEDLKYKAASAEDKRNREYFVAFQCCMLFERQRVSQGISIDLFWQIMGLCAGLAQRYAEKEAEVFNALLSAISDSASLRDNISAALGLMKVQKYIDPLQSIEKLIIIYLGVF
jgi:hypothetical protein